MLLLAWCWRGPAAETPLPVLETKGGVRMVRVPAGELAMGSATGQPNEAPVHRVRLNAFAMDQTPVTQAEYQRLMGTNPSRVKAPSNPVEMVRWSDAARYCNARSHEEGLEPCYDPKDWHCDVGKAGYRLPTEAEWEYACRAGTNTAYFFGDNAAMLQVYGWYARNPAKRPHPVGTKRPNPWGLLDMVGNVFQWCNDAYAADYSKTSPPEDPPGPAEGDCKVLRGGCFRSEPGECRSAARSKDTPGFSDACVGFDAYGFRCVRRLAE